MKPRRALGLAVADFYRNSWRLVPLNAAVGAVLVVAGIGAVAVRAALVVALLAGPLLAALTHSTVTLVRTGNVTLRDGLDGLRLYWRRGLVLGAAGGALLFVGVVAIHIYGGTPLWPLSFVTGYLLVLFGIYQLVLWTLAIDDPAASLGLVAGRAARFMARRPWPTLALGLLLAAINAAGIAAGLMPFLTLTVAFSFLAAAHFVLEAD